MISNATADAEKVKEGVQDGVIESIRHWSGQITRTLRVLRSLQTYSVTIIQRVQEEHPERQWSFGMHQDGVGHQLTIYTDPTDWDFDGLVEPIISLSVRERIGLYVVLLHLNDIE